LNSYGEVADRHEVDRHGVGTVDAEVISLPLIVATSIFWSEVMAVTAADGESHGPLPKPTRFALNAEELAAIIDGRS